VPKKVRDVVYTVVALTILAGLLMWVSPDLREEVTDSQADQQVAYVQAMAMHAFASTLGVVQGYAGDNNYLFVFMVAACVFVALMLRVIR
jgi:hypothetical protein